MSAATQIKIDPLVGSLFRTLLQPPEGTQVFCNTLAPCLQAIEQLVEHSACRVSGIAPEREKHTNWQSHSPFSDRNLEVCHWDDISVFDPNDCFHLGFGAFPFVIDPEATNERDAVRPAEIQDKLALFRCATDKPDRRVAYHLLGLEQLLKSVHCGGYFAAVLPKRWVGRETKYLRWWQDHAAQVCRIKLPASAVTFTDTKGKAQVAPGPWEFVMWNRPFLRGDEATKSSANNAHLLAYAEFRYAPFIFPLENALSFEAIKECHRAFLQHQWWTDNVRLWKQMLDKQKNNSWCGTSSPYPQGLSDPQKLYHLNADPSFHVGVRIEPDSAAIRKVRNAVHIKATGSSVKLTAYEPAALGALLDFRVAAGPIVSDEDGKRDFAVNKELKMLPYSELREKLLHGLENQGLVPCMTASDAQKMQRREKWLALQLTPMERLVPIKGGVEGQQSERMEDWEWLYEDIGMKATYPDVMEMWRKRVMKMGMDRITFDYQFDDLLYHLAKTSSLNGNVMGLGKTRQTLLVPIGRGASKVLIVCPAKLIGVWQDEIDNVIIPWMRRVRKDWQGKILQGGTNVIEWARDCLPENLKMFNIISYDRLKSVPRDGRFFKCPRCGTVAFSPFGGGKPGPTCPGDAFLDKNDPTRCNNLVKAWKAGNRGNPDVGDYVRRDGACLRKQKYKVVVDDSGKILHRIHWNDMSFPLEKIRIIDTRPPKPSIPRMVEQEHAFKKMVKVQVGTVTDELTGATVPNIKMVKRPAHVAWTFSDILRWTFNHVIADEALYFMNKRAMRSMAMNHLCAKSRWSLTGTPIKGYPHKILGILNWTFSRAVFPSYRPYDKGGLARFMRKYKTEVFVGTEKTPKILPKVNNPELFQAEIACLMRRHTRNEPPVVKDVPRKTVLYADFKLAMDDEHKEYYQQWLDKFAEWWQKMKEEEEGRGVQPGALLAKLSYLINASTIPHFMLEGIMKGDDSTEGKRLARQWFEIIGPYKGPPTAKMLKCRRLIEEAIAAGDKSLVFSIRRRNLDVGQAWCKARGLWSMIVDGTVPNTILKSTGRSKRHEMIENFKALDYHAMWAGLGALAEGVNIPEANRGIAMDYPWDPVELRQGFGRMLRPGQNKTVYCNHLIHDGAIDGYMAALCYLKDRSGSEGVDYMEFEDFSTDIIPDIQAYADAICEGPEAEAALKRKMWLAVDEIKKQSQEGDDEDINTFEEDDDDED